MCGQSSLHPADGPDSVGGADTDALERLLRERHSCRSYLAEPVPRAVVDRLLEIAARTPSWCNTQPWHLVITEGLGTEKFREALSAEAAGAMAPDFPFPDRYEGDYQARRRECARQLYESVGIEHGDRTASAAQTAKNFTLFGAPHVAVVTTEKSLGVYGAVDCGLYVDSFLLAAQSLGLGAIPQGALAAHSSFIRGYFGLPDSRRVVCGISFGWPDRNDPVNGFRTPRQSGAETATWVS
jgi:nitroreductase